MLAEKTLKLRHKLAYGTVHLLAPKLEADIRRSLKLICNDTPRPFTKMLKQKYGNTPLVGCEIGFGHGGNAESILQELNIKKLYCVDPYFGQQPYLDTGVMVDWYMKNEDSEKRIHKLYNHYPVVFVTATSDKAFQEGDIPFKLDFIYIDGCHTYDYALRDIKNSMTHVKKGGYVGGHDFANGGLTGVEQAVFRYYKATDNKPTCVYPDFWFRKEN